jgi:hypothetical protein
MFPYSDYFVNFSPDGQRCLVSNSGRTLQVWQLRRSGPLDEKATPGLDENK